MGRKKKRLRLLKRQQDAATTETLKTESEVKVEEEAEKKAEKKSIFSKFKKSTKKAAKK